MKDKFQRYPDNVTKKGEHATSGGTWKRYKATKKSTDPGPVFDIFDNPLKGFPYNENIKIKTFAEWNEGSDQKKDK